MAFSVFIGGFVGPIERPDEFVDLFLRSFFGKAVAFLNLADELIAVTIDCSKVVDRQFARVSHATMLGAKEKAKETVDSDAKEHGHLTATDLSMVSDSCKK